MLSQYSAAALATGVADGSLVAVGVVGEMTEVYIETATKKLADAENKHDRRVILYELLHLLSVVVIHGDGQPWPPREYRPTVYCHPKDRGWIKQEVYGGPPFRVQ